MNNIRFSNPKTLLLSGSAIICLVATSPLRAEDIHQAVMKGDVQTVTSILASDNRLLNEPDERGRTLVNLAAEYGQREITRLLIERGANIDLADRENRLPLHSAAAKGDLTIAGMLLEKRTSAVDDTTCTRRGGMTGGWTPLHLAAQNGHPAIVQLLLDNGADIEARDGAQRTPLILAAESNNVRVAEILIERGADVNAEAIRGYTALLYGARNRFEKYVNLLIEKKARISPDALPRAFEMAVESGMEGLYKYVLALGCNVDELRQRDPDLIFPAAAGGSAAIVKSLVEHGFDPAHEDPNGFRPIHAAAMEGRTGVIEYLAGLGLDLNARNKKGESAFNLALMKGLDQTVELLKKKGADTSAPVLPVLEGPYMGQEPPGDTPQIFLPGIVSGLDRAHSSITFSPDGLEAYWTEMVPPEGRVAYMQVRNGKWTYPAGASIDRDPTFSPDGNRLYFIKTRPFREGEVPGGDPDVKEEYWYMERMDTGWSEPISVGEAVNVKGVHWPCSVDDSGNLYFSEFSDSMYCSHFVEGAYQKPIPLAELFNNATLVGQSPFISRGGDYLLFSTKDSLYISFKREDGSWTDKTNLGDVVNASHTNGSPRVTADGKYIFFVSAGRGRPWGIYWVDARIIDRLKVEHVRQE